MGIEHDEYKCEKLAASERFAPTSNYLWARLYDALLGLKHVCQDTLMLSLEFCVLRFRLLKLA